MGSHGKLKPFILTGEAAWRRENNRFVIENRLQARAGGRVVRAGAHAPIFRGA
jgi:hypothetical protein